MSFTPIQLQELKDRCSREVSGFDNNFSDAVLQALVATVEQNTPIAFTPGQLRDLQVKCNQLKVEFLAQAVRSNAIRLDALPTLAPARKAFIETAILVMAIIDSMKPDPQEQADWAAIVELGDKPADIAACEQKLNAYITAYATSLPSGNHVDEARQRLTALKQLGEQRAWAEIEAIGIPPSDPTLLEQKLYDYLKAYGQENLPGSHVREASQLYMAILEERERAAWDAVDKTDYDALKAYLKANPTSQFVPAAEDAIWAISQLSRNDLLRYLNDFPEGAHAEDARRGLTAFTAWEQVRMYGNAKDIVDFLQRYPDTPFAENARILLGQKKQDLLNEMSVNPSGFRAEDVKGYLDYGIFSESDLLAWNVVNERALELIRNAPPLSAIHVTSTPDIQSYADMTDVFLFGVPSSGKTCVLSGLIGSLLWSDLDFVAYNSGNYINYLTLCRRYGIVPKRTDGNFVALIKAAAKEQNRANVVHEVNLVDMAGEDFATKIVANPDGIVRFEDMGVGATNLLSNTNRKVIFIVIDPSSDGLIQIDRKDADGNPIIGPDGQVVRDITSQDLILRRMISMLNAPENRSVLNYVDTIHFVMSKADILGPREQRDANALQVFNTNYRQSLDSIITMCKANGINAATDGHPMLHTFSLGQFYIGGVYDYDSTDSDKLVDVIRKVTRGRRVRGAMGHVRDAVN